jgi:hypothetical protein
MLFALLALGSPANSSQCDRSLFESALENESTSPSYVLITVIDENSGGRSVVCTEAPFLLGALHRELGADYGQEGVARVKAAALASPGLEFRFTKSKALANVRSRYTAEMLEAVRARLTGLSDVDLLDGFAWSNGPLHDIYTSAPDRGAYRDAIAHVLLERCIGVRRADRSGMLQLRADRLTRP